jgi:hypothetical protein
MMCKGTRCTHDSDPVVQYLEEPYDSWVFKRSEYYSQYRFSQIPDAILIRVEGRTTTPDAAEGMGNGPGYDQAMIRLKDDLGAQFFMSDEEVQKLMHCPPCGRGDHRCDTCGKSITHMAKGLCLDCALMMFPSVGTQMRANG